MEERIRASHRLSSLSTLWSVVLRAKEGPAAAPGIADVGELQDAYVLLSAVQYSTGRDEEGARSLARGLALAPSREPPPR